MTILNVRDEKGGYWLHSFMINYTMEERLLLRDLMHKYDKDWYVVDPLAYDQIMVAMYDALPRRYKKKLTVNELDIPYENYQNGGWKYLCKSGLYPAKNDEDEGRSFIPEIPRWIFCSDELPEKLIKCTECIKNSNSIIENVNLSETDKVLVMLNDGDVKIDRRILKPDGWIWETSDADNVHKWMKIPE